MSPLSQVMADTPGASQGTVVTALGKNRGRFYADAMCKRQIVFANTRQKEDEARMSNLSQLQVPQISRRSCRFDWRQPTRF